MTGEKKQITRSRTSYSCQTCRRRKVRCDKQHPRCGGCTKGDEVCVYGDLDKAESTQRSSSIDLGRKRRATDNDGSDESGGQGPLPAFQSIEQKLSQLTDLVRDVNRMTPISMDNSPDGGRLQQHASSRHSSIVRQNSTGSYFDNRIDVNHAPNGSLDYDGPWEKVLGKLEQLNVLLKAGLRAQITPANLESGNGSTSHNYSPGQIDSSQPRTHSKQPSAFDGIDAKVWQAVTDKNMLCPSGEESAVLFRSWLWSIYPILPILSPSTVLRKYQTFNHWYTHGLDKGEPNPDPSFMPFLVIIWYTGYKNLTDKGRERWFKWQVSNPYWTPRLRTIVEQYLEVIKVEAMPSVYSLAAAVTSHALAIGGQDIVSNHMRNTLNLRAAQGLGVHSERTMKDLSVPEAEMRRRIWWEALSVDTSISTVSGMPVVFDERYTDTKLISELKESCMGTQDATEYEAHLEEPGSSPDRPDDPANWQTSSLVSVYHLVARARHILTVATKKVLKANMSAGQMKMEELRDVRKAMQQVGDEIRNIINRIQTRGIPELDFIPDTSPPSEVDHLDSMGEELTLDEINYFLREESNTKGSNPIMKYHRSVTIAFHKWARIMLSMLIDRLDCISYAPFLKNSKSRLWAVARNCALRSCHAYMRKFLCLAEDPELRMFRWAWTSSYHPMHATIIMLIDVHDRPHSDEASRSRAMIDRIFSLISPSEITAFPQLAATDVLPLKEGGDEAWGMLRKLRHKAWQNAGLDPDVLWTEEDQLSVGVGKPLHENDLFVRSLREDIILKHKQRKERENALVPGGAGFSFHGPSFEAARKQRMHPSEVGQGDQISGSVVRDVADFDSISMVPQILLLRARNDQELMPYPVMGRGPESITIQDGQHQQAAKESTDQNGEEVQVFHIGELIQKIRQSKRTNNTDKTTPVPQMYTSLSSQPLPPVTAAKDFSVCDFRTLRSVENAAYQDIFDGRTAQNTIPVTNLNSQTPSGNVDYAAPYSYTSNSSNQYPMVIADSNSADRSLVLRNQSYHQGNSDASFSMMPDTSPALHDHDFTISKPQVSVQGGYGIYHFGIQQPQIMEGQQGQIITSTSQLLPAQMSTLVVSNPTVNDAFDTGTALDIEFDWNRWDEMFGQFTGLAEMFMEGDGTGLSVEDHFSAGLH